jgi:hypothetical protein
MPMKTMLYLINPNPGNPEPISRESENEKIVGITGIREQEIPGMKHYCLRPLPLDEPLVLARVVPLDHRLRAIVVEDDDGVAQSGGGGQRLMLL